MSEVVHGVEVRSRYGIQQELDAASEFVNLCHSFGVSQFLKEVFFDSKNGLCCIETDNELIAHKDNYELIRWCAKELFYQYVLDYDMEAVDVYGQFDDDFGEVFGEKEQRCLCAGECEEGQDAILSARMDLFRVKKLIDALVSRNTSTPEVKWQLDIMKSTVNKYLGKWIDE